MLPYNKDIGFLLGIFHDFGKATSFYQKFIQSKINNEPLLDVNEREKSHTAVGALFCLFFFNNYLDNERKRLLPSILNCSFHHSVLSDIDSLIINQNKFSDEVVINAQLKDLQERLPVLNVVYKNELIDFIRNDNDPVLSSNFIPIITNIDFSEFFNHAEKLRDLIRPVYQTYKQNIKEKGDNETAFFTTALYGSLVNADRELADKLPDAFIKTYKNNLYPSNIDANIIKRYVTDEFGNTDELKSLVFNTIDAAINNENVINYKIFNITAPTGSGKTETALNFAFKLRDKINAKRIIYALPLTNILEQNYYRLHKIFQKYLPDYKDANSLYYLLKYHYLANYDGLLNENDSLGEALKNAERFNSQVIVTTYIQILYGLISNSPHFLSRLPLFHNSVILFDEPQVLSPDHWVLINNGLKLLTEKFNCKVILLTATKPLIFKDSECYELTKSIDFNYYKTCRTTLIPSLHVNDFNSLTHLIMENAEKYNSILVLLNTIKSSIEFYNILRNISDLKSFKIYYLSTNLIPIHRQEIIDKVSELLECKKKVILVSTQVIEAGVEFDFDMGVRDLATFDSIVQTAGRINRKGDKETSPLYIIKLQHDKTKRYYSSYIYDDAFLRFTEELLGGNIEVNELEYQNLTEEYFKKISNFMLDFNEVENDKNVIYNYVRCQFEKLSANFKIIEDDVDKLPMLIPFDNDVISYISDYKNILLKLKDAKYEEKWELKRLLEYSKRKIIPYLVNISTKSLQIIHGYLLNEKDSPLSWVRFVDKNFLEYCYKYDSKTKIGEGLVLNSESEGLWI